MIAFLRMWSVHIAKIMLICFAKKDSSLLYECLWLAVRYLDGLATQLSYSLWLEVR